MFTQCEEALKKDEQLGIPPPQSPRAGVDPPIDETQPFRFGCIIFDRDSRVGITELELANWNQIREWFKRLEPLREVT